LASRGCVFCAIAAGDQDAWKVWEDDLLVAFLDSRPVFPGHTLIVPRAHHETLVDVPDELFVPLFGSARAIAAAMPKAIGADGSFVAINNKVSQSVPHLHVHVVPRRFKDGLRGFFWPRQKYASDAEAKSVAASIRAAIAELALDS
jgi:histidine triad (HIT) family protein